MPNTENSTNTLLHKNPSTGHAGHEVYLCHRCGWPFPNPHPSARHRRAHKRVCGTIEGFAITQPKSDDSDDDNSDDNNSNNHHAPSHVIEKTNSKEAGIGGVGKMSRKSEDDVFSDAITEFSDGSSGIGPLSVDKIVENKSIDEPVNDIVDKAPLLNGSTSTVVSDSGATVDAKEHPEGLTLEADPKPEPLPVEQCNESQPDLVKSEIPRDVAVDTNLQIEGGVLPSVTLDSDEAKTSDRVTEVVKQDPTIAPTTLKEMDTVKEDVISADKTSYAEEPLMSQVKIDSVVQLTPSTDSPCDLDSAEKPLEQVSRSEVVKQDPSILPTTLKEMDTVKEDVISADKTSYAEEPLKCASQNGGGDAMTSQEKIDLVVQLTPSTDSPCDLDSAEKPLEQVSRSESRLPDSDSRDDDAKKPSDELHTEHTCDIQLKSDIKQVDPVDIAEPSIEIAPVIIGSENLTESCNNEINGSSAEVSTGVSHDGNVAESTEHLEDPTLSTQEPSLLNQKCSEETPSNVDGCTDADASNAVPTSDDKPVASENFSFTPPPFVSATGDDNGKVASVDLKSVQDESDLKLTKEIGGVSTVYPSNHSTATSDSMEVNCGSVSEADFQETKTTAEKRDYKKSDDFEPPSFMTLVQSGDKVDKVPAASEIETVQNNLELKSDALQAAWFPSITNVVNESEGRKKNEEKIAKVTNWSPGRQHGPLKNLLSDAKSPNTKQIPATDLKDEEVVNGNGDVATKVNCAPDDAKANKEMDKEWDSPAKYPIENKKEKKKKGKSFWIPFACCSSVHREL